MELTFLGAAGTVTGSKYLLTTSHKKILIDCGLFQGLKELRQRNWQPLPFDPKNLDAVLLTHAHIDHTGYLPLLIKNGFAGKVHCTQGTLDLCSILLPDSGYLQEEEAKYSNKKGYSKHSPAKPLYTCADAEVALKQFQPHPYQKEISLGEDFSITFLRAGHIIGSALIKIRYQNTTLVFSGDLGRSHDYVMQAPEFIQETDYLVLESTYGDRLHDKELPEDFLKNTINKTIKRGGSVIIPSFAVGRTQSLLYFIATLKQKQAIPDIPIYLDSPMAIDCTQLLCKNFQDLRLSPDTCKQTTNIATYVNKVEQSKQLDLDKTPKIIISASGMVEGGRILHHVKAYAPDPKNTLIFTGYQSVGTRGEAILNGASEIKLLGEIIKIGAEVAVIESISAHADYQEILDWLTHLKKSPKKIFLIHGELSSSTALKEKIKKQFGWSCVIPKQGEKIIL